VVSGFSAKMPPSAVSYSIYAGRNTSTAPPMINTPSHKAQQVAGSDLLPVSFRPNFWQNVPVFAR